MLNRSVTYTFRVDTSAFHEFSIHLSPGVLATSDRLVSPSLTGQGANLNASLIWTIDATANVSIYYYQCERHATQFNSITLDSGASIPPSNPRSNSALLTAHIVLMTIAFAVLLPLGALTSSFLPYKAVLWWFPLHATLAVAALCCMFAGFGCILAYVSYEGSHFTLGGIFGPTLKAHQVFGMVVISLVVCQACLGILSDTLWRYRFRKTGAMPLPGWFPEKTHWWLGRTIVLVSVIQIFLGLAEAQPELLFGDWVFGVYAAWYGILVGVLALLLYKLRVDIKKARAAKNLRARLEAPMPEILDDGGETDFRARRGDDDSVVSGLVEL